MFSSKFLFCGRLKLSSTAIPHFCWGQLLSRNGELYAKFSVLRRDGELEAEETGQTKTTSAFQKSHFYLKITSKANWTRHIQRYQRNNLPRVRFDANLSCSEFWLRKAICTVEASTGKPHQLLGLEQKKLGRPATHCWPSAQKLIVAGLEVGKYFMVKV